MLLKKAIINVETVQAGITLVNGDKEAGETTVKVTDKAGNEGATIAEEVKIVEIESDAAEGTQPDCGHSLLHPTINVDKTEAQSEELSTSSPEKKSLLSQLSSLASEVAAQLGCLSSTTVEDAEGEVSVMSAANKSCGGSCAVVAKVLGPGDCCKVTSEDTVTSIGV